MTGPGEPVWIPLATLHLLHARQIELFGGPYGVRDEGAVEGAVEGALARPLNAWGYGQATDIETLAATYLCALTRQQCYLDGNERTALAAALVFLRLNGRSLVAPADELYAVVMAAAAEELGVEQVAERLRRNV